MKVKDLIVVLQKAPQDAEVECTWEGQEREADGVYMASDGRVLIDSDACFYMDHKRGIR